MASSRFRTLHAAAALAACAGLVAMPLPPAAAQTGDEVFFLMRLMEMSEAQAKGDCAAYARYDSMFASPEFVTRIGALTNGQAGILTRLDTIRARGCTPATVEAEWDDDGRVAMALEAARAEFRRALVDCDATAFAAAKKSYEAALGLAMGAAAEGGNIDLRAQLQGEQRRISAMSPRACAPVRERTPATPTPAPAPAADAGRPDGLAAYARDITPAFAARRAEFRAAATGCDVPAFGQARIGYMAELGTAIGRAEQGGRSSAGFREALLREEREVSGAPPPNCATTADAPTPAPAPAPAVLAGSLSGLWARRSGGQSSEWRIEEDGANFRMFPAFSARSETNTTVGIRRGNEIALSYPPGGGYECPAGAPHRDVPDSSRMIVADDGLSLTQWIREFAVDDETCAVTLLDWSPLVRYEKVVQVAAAPAPRTSGCRDFTGYWDLGDGGSIDMQQSAGNSITGFFKFGRIFGDLEGTATGDTFIGSYTGRDGIERIGGSIALRLASDGKTLAGTFHRQSDADPIGRVLNGTCRTAPAAPAFAEISLPEPAVWDEARRERYYSLANRIERRRTDGDCLTAEDEIMLMQSRLNQEMDGLIERQALLLTQVDGASARESEEIVITQETVQYYIDWTNNALNAPCISPP